MSSTAHFSTQRFPNEVISLICEEVSLTETLWALCRTSRTLFVIAQPILYRCVKLDGRRMGSVRNWCRTVSKHTYLAGSVRSLGLTLPALGILDPQDAQKIFTAMRRCVNLEEIEVASHSPHSDEGAPCMLPVTPFPRLTKLRTPHFYLDESFIEFVQSQPTIRMLEVRKSGGSTGVYQQWRSCDAANVLPQLIAVAGPMHALPLNHHLERIETEPRLNGLGFLAIYSASLTTLNLVLPQFDAFRMLKPLIRSAAAHLPALVHLALV
ncbi:hypothetical protein MKEN_00742000 [Mycena kentingensis (nom. inval.)]|nr:hypothetical protein MKEN_00742000 [Mycena kentingensis (nom. inval.)]